MYRFTVAVVRINFCHTVALASAAGCHHSFTGGIAARFHRFSTMTITIDKLAAGTTAATLAVLPAQMLHVAAQFASKDAAKGGLCWINVRKNGDTITIASTNGHHLFRVRITDTAYYLERELLLPVAVFKKRIAKADYVIIDNQGMAHFRGSTPGLIQSIPCANGCEHIYPEYERLIPDSFHCSSGKAIAFNAGYMATFLKEARRLCVNGVVAMQFNDAHQPIVLTGESALDGSGARVTMEYLLMPVRVRE